MSKLNLVLDCESVRVGTNGDYDMTVDLSGVSETTVEHETENLMGHLDMAVLAKDGHFQDALVWAAVENGRANDWIAALQEALTEKAEADRQRATREAV